MALQSTERTSCAQINSLHVDLTPAVLQMLEEVLVSQPR